MPPIRNHWLQSNLVGKSQGPEKVSRSQGFLEPGNGTGTLLQLARDCPLEEQVQFLLALTRDPLQPAYVILLQQKTEHSKQTWHCSKASLVNKWTQTKTVPLPERFMWDLKLSYVAEIFLASQDKHSFWHWKLFFGLQARKPLHPFIFHKKKKSVYN